MKVRIAPAALLLLFLAARHSPLRFCALLTAVAVHEAGHLAAARMLSLPVRKLEFDVFGARLFTAPLPSYSAECILAGAGPLFSLAAGFAFLPLKQPFFATVSAFSFSFALLNLLPVSGFDGGRMLAALLAARRGPYFADRALALASYLSLLFLFSLSACLLLRFGRDPALALLSAVLFARQFIKTRT